MSYIDVNSSLGLTSTGFNPTKSDATGKSQLDKDDFLTLLITQLSNQDPMNPMEDKEFTAQMAQFSSLEQLTEISEGIETLNKGSERTDMLTAVSFIGKEVVAKGNTFSKTDDGVTSIWYEIEEPMASGFVNIYDEAGGMVQTIQLEAAKPGRYEIKWDGKDFKGNKQPNGIYGVGMAAEGAEGQPVLVSMDVGGTVSGVKSENGGFYLQLKDGRTVDFASIKEVVDSKKSAETTTEPEAESGSGS